MCLSVLWVLKQSLPPMLSQCRSATVDGVTLESSGANTQALQSDDDDDNDHYDVFVGFIIAFAIAVVLLIVAAIFVSWLQWFSYTCKCLVCSTACTLNSGIVLVRICASVTLFIVSLYEKCWIGVWTFGHPLWPGLFFGAYRLITNTRSNPRQSPSHKRATCHTDHCIFEATWTFKCGHMTAAGDSHLQKVVATVRNWGHSRSPHPWCTTQALCQHYMCRLRKPEIVSTCSYCK